MFAFLVKITVKGKPVLDDLHFFWWKVKMLGVIVKGDALVLSVYILHIGVDQR